MRAPDYHGGGLLNLVAELEKRLTGEAPAATLDSRIADSVPSAHSYVLVLFDGLGDHQLAHPAAVSLAASRVGVLDAPFPTTTTVSLATIATGTAPAQHGLLAYQLWLPEVDAVVGTIKWTTLWGDPIELDHDGFLPRPNLWERLTAAGIEPVTVQPWTFEGSALSATLYRGCRFEAYLDEREAVAATVELAAQPGRLVFLYAPHVDFAAHVAGQGSGEYTEALRAVSTIWDGVSAGLPREAVAVGTADHGHVDVLRARHAEIPLEEHTDRIFSGDPRCLFVHGEGATLAGTLPARWLPRSEMEHWWGPGPRHPRFEERAPDGVLVAEEGCALLHRFSDRRLIGRHGAPTPEEMEVPLLVAGV
jgi:hypothetical protein